MAVKCWRDFGQALGDALTAPLDLFNSLSGKASWLLEKLGLIKTSRVTSTPLRQKQKRHPPLLRAALIFRVRGPMAAIRGISQPSPQGTLLRRSE